MAQPSGDQLFTTSWTLHRLSPLYHGREYQTLIDNPEALRVYADRFRDILRGDVFRGVQIGIDSASALDDAVAKAGPLNTCKWETLPTWSHWNEEQSLLEDADQELPIIPPESSAGILVTLNYDHAIFKAALLVGPDGYHDDRKEVTHLPLLVTRLPNVLRQTFISFLSGNFDTHCSILRLPSSFLCATLENYLASLSTVATHPSGSSGISRLLIEKVIKETHLTLSFPPPISPSLKTLDVHLPRESLSTFFAHGSKMTSTSNRRYDIEEARESSQKPTVPFITALSLYFDTHLAMNLDISELRDTTKREKEHIRLTKVVCGAFVLGGEGRMKLLANPGRALLFDEMEAEDGGDDDSDSREIRAIWKANEGLLRSLIERAIGSQGQV